MTGDLLHGGALDRMQAAFPDGPRPWIDLSTGINPWPYPAPALSPESLQHLPTRAAQDRCRHAMAQAFGAPEDSLVLAPGSELLIRLLPQLISPKRVALLNPTYGDHAQVWRRAGAIVIETDAPLALADTVDAIVLCNPNNPDGRQFSPEELETARETLARRGGWLIVDEAYADLDPSLSVAGSGGAAGLIVLRSFGKFFGLAGVRLGAALAPARIRAALSDLLGEWPVSGAALVLGPHAYEDHAWQSCARLNLTAARERLDDILLGAGFPGIQGTDLFRLVTCDDAHATWRLLAEAGLYVRRFAWSGNMLRIGLPATLQAERRLREALIP